MEELKRLWGLWFTAVMATAISTRMARQSSLVDTRVIYCGDNLEQLRKLPDSCIDLIYIDPPFNSNRNYEVFWGETKEKRAFEDRHESTQAYIEFMRPRCVELARVLKKTGSFYYHCDWHASHYVKVMLDQIFSENNFLNEIIWKRSAAHSDTKQGRKAYGNVSDSIFVYSGGNDKERVWNAQYRPYDESYVNDFYKYKEEGTGRRYRLDNLTAAKPGGDVSYEFHGTRPYKGRYWAYSKENMEKFLAEGRLYFPKNGGTPSYKRYLDEMPGVSLQNVWDDIPPIASTALERTGYPTQKPLKLLERILEVSSNENDIVLDAFCGCGTALAAAQNLNRQWIGIDVSPTACRVMAKRLRDVCRLREDENYWRHGRGFVVRGLPWTEKQLRVIPPFEFENWAVIALGGIPNKTQVGDMGIDGRIYPVGSEPPKKPPTAARELDFMDDWYPIQVKQRDKVGRPDIDQFETAMARTKRKKGFVVGFDFSSDALREINGFFRREHAVIVPLTVREVLDETIAQKLA
jgi:DNA modification methylase